MSDSPQGDQEAKPLQNDSEINQEEKTPPQQQEGEASSNSDNHSTSWWNSVYSKGYSLYAGEADSDQSGDASAQSIPGSASGSNWLKNMYSTAVDQSNQMWDFMKRDIGEFANVMHCDTRLVAQKTADTVKEKLNTQDDAGGKLRAGLSKMMEQVSRSLTVPPDDEGEETLLLHHGNLQPCTDRLTARVQALQLDPSTYETEPTPREEFARWMEIFDVDARKPAISDILVSQAEVRALYTRLVPHTLLHKDFWARYFYRVDKVEEEEERRQSLKKRAERPSREESSSKWEDEWDVEEQREESRVIEPASSPDPAQQSDESATPVMTGDKNVEMDESPTQPEKKEINEVAESSVCDEGMDEVKEHRMQERGDLVVIKHPGSADTSSGHTSNSNPDQVKDDWDDDLDIELTEEDIQKAKELAKTMDCNLEDDERWEEWN